MRFALMARVSSAALQMQNEANLNSDSEIKDPVSLADSPASPHEVRRLLVVNNHGPANISLMGQKVSKVSAGLSKLQACARDFRPFPMNGDEARNSFIVDLAYERGCVMNDVGKEVNASVDIVSESKSCEDDILDMQAMSNTQLNEQCTHTASFPDMCAGCLESKNLRHVGECNLMSLTERKNTIISELQRLDGSTTIFPEAEGYQRMSPYALIQDCASKKFTDWCAVLESCGAPAVQDCAKLSQEDKKNTFIYLAIASMEGHDAKQLEGILQNKTDVVLKAGCHEKMSLITSKQVEEVGRKVAREREERLRALQDRRSFLEQFSISNSK